MNKKITIKNYNNKLKTKYHQMNTKNAIFSKNNNNLVMKLHF